MPKFSRVDVWATAVCSRILSASAHKLRVPREPTFKRNIPTKMARIPTSMVVKVVNVYERKPIHHSCHHMTALNRSSWRHRTNKLCSMCIAYYEATIERIRMSGLGISGVPDTPRYEHSRDRKIVSHEHI